MKLKFTPSISVFAAGILLLCSCGHNRAEKSSDPVRVKTISVAESTVAGGRTYSGVIEESSGTELSFKIPGTLKTLAVEEGQFINKGQLVGVVDAASLESNLRIAQAAEATAQDTYNRMKTLHDAEAIPEMRWVEVQNALSTAKSATEIARNALNDAKIYAPFSGYVSKKYADVGNTMAPAMPVIKLVEINPAKISISVSENEISAITHNTVASVVVPSLGNYTVEAKLSDKGVSADPLSRTFPVRFICGNADRKMLPGMLCNVSLKSDSGASDAIVIPVESVLLADGNQSFVWTVSDGKAHRTDITLGAYTPDGVIVEAGLSKGDELIVAGQQKISEGMAVTPVNK